MQTITIIDVGPVISSDSTRPMRVLIDDTEQEENYVWHVARVLPSNIEVTAIALNNWLANNIDAATLQGWSTQAIMRGVTTVRTNEGWRNFDATEKRLHPWQRAMIHRDMVLENNRRNRERAVLARHVTNGNITQPQSNALTPPANMTMKQAIAAFYAQLNIVNDNR